MHGRQLAPTTRSRARRCRCYHYCACRWKASPLTPEPETHSLTQICWKKCVTGSIKNPKLDRSEEGCLANCVDRFLDVNFLTMKHLNGMRSS